MIITSIRHHKLFALSVFILFSLLHLYIVVLNHYNFKTYAFDYGVYNFAFYDFAHFRISPVTVYLAGFNITFLQDHFSLTLVFLSPFYWLLSPVFGTYTLLIIQWFFIILGAWATYQYILLKAKDHFIALAAMVFYFVLYGRFSAYQSDCNLAIMGSALVPVFLLFFETKRFVPACLMFLFLVLNREDFALNMFFLSMFLFITHRRDLQLKRFAALLGFSSILFFIIIFKLIIPSLEDVNKSFSLFNYQALGKDPMEALIFVFSHPIDSISLLFKNHTANEANNWIKVKFYALYAISGGFLLLYRPVYLIALMPLIAKKMYNDDSFRWSHEGYNGVELASILPILVYSIVADLRSKPLKIGSSLFILALTISASVYCISTSTPFYYGFNKFNLFSGSFYVSDFNPKTINKILEEIPDTAVVCASNRILPHLALRKKIFYFPQINEAAYVCLSIRDSPYPVSQEEYNSRVQQLRQNTNWMVLKEQDDCVLFKRIKW